MRSAAPLTLAVLLVLAAFPPVDAAADGFAAGWQEVLVIDTAKAGATKMFEAFDTASLNLHDFNGDGRMEIVANNDNNVAYVLDSKTGRALAQIETFHYNNTKWPVRELNPIAIGPLYGDGAPCLVIPNSAAWMSAWCYNAGASSADKFQFDKKWEVRVDAAKYEPTFKADHPWMYYESNGTLRPEYGLGLDGNAYLADVDGDKKMEVFVETDGYPGQLAFNHDGSYRWSRSWWDGNAGAIVRDIDKDGTKETVFFSDSGAVASYNAKTGVNEWSFEAGRHGAWPGSIPVPGLVVDLHGDGLYETIFGARNVVQDQSDPNWINLSHARYYALDSKGKMLWNVSYDWMNPLQYNHPAPIDVNGDGVLDIVFLDWNTIGHKPGKWNTTNRPSNLFALNGRDGTPLWHVGVGVYWSNKDFVIMDVNGDGQQEIVTPSSRFGSEGLAVHALADGAFKGFFPISWSMARGPVAGNLYGDGKAYLVVPVMKRVTDKPNYRSLDVGYREGQLRIVATNANYDVEFSANFLLNDEQKDARVQGTIGTPPPAACADGIDNDGDVLIDALDPGCSGTTDTDESNAILPTPTPTPTPQPTPEPTPTPSPSPSPTPEATPTPEPTPSPTPEVTPLPTETSPPSPSPEPVPSPSPTPEESNVPGAGLALVAAACAAALVMARGRAKR